MIQFLLRLSTPIQKFMQKLSVPEPKTDFETAVELQEKLKAGDILLSRESFHFTNLFIPGFWSHAVIYGEGYIIEATGNGVRMEDFKTWLVKKHNWCVVRPVSQYQTGDKAWSKAFEALGDKYDYEFCQDNKQFYCSELVAWAWNNLWEGCVTPERIYNWGMLEDERIIEEHRD